MTVEMHLAMAEAYGTSDQLDAEWPGFVASLGRQVDLLLPELSTAAGPLWDRLYAVGGVGPSVRAHGDYHLGQVMRTDSGWHLLDFEGEPGATTAADIGDEGGGGDAAPFRLRLAVRPARRAEAELPALEPLAVAWGDRNRGAFLKGYYDSKGIDELLAAAPGDMEAVRLAFEVDKAIYELGYERAYRPDWAAIPLAALRRLFWEPAGAPRGALRPWREGLIWTRWMLGKHAPKRVGRLS